MNTNGKHQQQNHSRNGTGKQQSQANAATPCTSPWTEAYQFAFAEDSQRTHDDSVQPTLDALSDIYDRGYV